MAKYIDADKLKAEIERYIKDVKDAEKRLTPNMGFFDAKLSGIYDVMNIVDSLQQEQYEGLHFTPLNRLIQKIPSENWNDTINNYAKKLRDCLIEEGYRKDAEVLQGYISYMNGNNVPMATMDEQEQQEVDLEEDETVTDCNEYSTVEEELDAFIKSGKAIKEENCGTYTTTYIDPLKVACHFYQLGLNTRKI